MDLTFKEFKELFQKNYKLLSMSATHMFTVLLDKEELWNLYLDSFPKGTNEIFRENKEFDCSCCKSFIKTMGNVVFIVNNEIKTLWEFETGEDKYQPVIDALDKFVKSHHITNVFVTRDNTIGTDKNEEKTPHGTIIWHHFFLELPNKYVYDGIDSLDTVRGNYRTEKSTFKRSLEELSEDSVKTVLELIADNTIYRGEEWKGTLETFLQYQQEYKRLPESKKDIYVWDKSVNAGSVINKIRNHSMGTLLIDITEGMDLTKAVKRYEAIVAPENYKRSKPIISQRQIEEAEKTVERLGYLPTLQRRHATLDDITYNNILWSNKDVARRIRGSIFDELKEELSVNVKKFDRVEEVSLEKFLNDILPTAKEIELLFENKHSSNLMSVIAPVNKDAKNMFKHDNLFTWAYKDNLTDSSMKQLVKLAGGDVEGDLNFRLMWNTGTKLNPNDFDAHCIEANGNHIYYGNKGIVHRSSGKLDVDIITPQRGVPAVENITWKSRSQMPDGIYQMYVKNYSDNGGREGFDSEIECDGQIHEFSYPHELKQGEEIVVATVVLHNGQFTVNPELDSSLSSKEIWGIATNQWKRVSVIMPSPNHWDGQKGVGNKHIFFILDGCKNPTNPNGFFNEQLNSILLPHRKVFEVLGSRMKVEYSENQLSGVGFSTTQSNEVTLKIIGQTERIIKVKI